MRLLFILLKTRHMCNSPQFCYKVKSAIIIIFLLDFYFLAVLYFFLFSLSSFHENDDDDVNDKEPEQSNILIQIFH